MPLRSPSALPAMAALLLGAASTMPVLAQDSAPPERLTPAQQQAIFPERKALLLKNQRERIQILQRSERCTQRAASTDALRQCMRSQKQAYRALRQQQRDALSKIYAQYGIDSPVGGPGGRKGKGRS